MRIAAIAISLIPLAATYWVGAGGDARPAAEPLLEVAEAEEPEVVVGPPALCARPRVTLPRVSISPTPSPAPPRAASPESLAERLARVQLCVPAWDRADVRSVVAAVERAAGIRIDVSADAWTPAIDRWTLDPDDSTTARALLDLAAERWGLGWSVRDEHVSLHYGMGGVLATRELADMIANGTATEQAWAREFLREANLPEPKAEIQEAEAICFSRSEVRVRAHVCLLTASRHFLRDIGVDIRGLGDDSGSVNCAIDERPGLSGATFLDDTQLEVILRVAEKGRDAVRTIAKKTAWFVEGERNTLDVGNGGILTLEGAVSENRRFVTMSFRLRFLADHTLMFVPHSTMSVPDGGTLLLHAGDVLLPGERPTEVRMVLLTLEIVA